MILAGHQPNYLPYVGFFNKAMNCDIFELTDHVQYTKKEWQNRNKIRTTKGWMWLTVPVLNKYKHEQKINEVRIDNDKKWSDKHWKSLQLNYKKSPFFHEYRDFFDNIYSKKWERLVDLNITIIRYLFEQLDIRAKIIRSSELNIEENKTGMIIEMCKKLNADTYLSGMGGVAYLQESKFKEKDIRLIYQNFKHPIYDQRFTPFISNLSTIDLMFNYGSEKSRDIILNSGA